MKSKLSSEALPKSYVPVNMNDKWDEPPPEYDFVSLQKRERKWPILGNAGFLLFCVMGGVAIASATIYLGVSFFQILVSVGVANKPMTFSPENSEINMVGKLFAVRKKVVDSNCTNNPKL